MSEKIGNEKKEGCVLPAKGPVTTDTKDSPDNQENTPDNRGITNKEESIMTVKIGKPAPDFETSAFFNGGFTNIKLSDYRGKWVIVCFYPGDFTFV